MVNRNRHLKASGSIKCGSTCPAIMKVTTETVDEITEIHVQYQSVHIGHELEVGKLPLSKEKTNLAASLTLGIPFIKILDETRQNFHATNRVSLTTRKDLHNIRREFEIGEHVLHADDSTSVDLLVKKMSKENENPILIYKPGGETLSDFPAITEKDFLLGMMNNAQEKLFECYGKTCVMIESTHGTNQYSFELLTVMVHDENHEGLPAAALFSSRMTCEVLLPFFEAIKQRLPNMTTNILMTDDTTSFLNAWEKVFQDNPRHLLCSWHINKNWNANIQSKIKK
ncbi:hypothetical protein AVEN_162887-1 [Araneus ventricosus]|uniref:MULE transposase domain-containing protein n=1 Tax=Araneus ventricosus TaxID=182803 RepID=A0A4Y2WJA3_ARAVE|nr:hypothetical protein AVEN_162887-1 [Araneus ventricosus]